MLPQAGVHIQENDALLELIECADGIDDEGVVNLTDTNAHLFDFLDLLRHPEPIPEEYLAPAETPSKRGKPSATPESETDEPGRPKVLAFPGVTLDEVGKEADEEETDVDDDVDDLDIDGFIKNADLPDDIIAALEEFRATGKLSDALDGDDESLFVDDDPSLVNSDPYGAGWMIKLKLADPGEISSLLSADGYSEHIG